MRHFNSDRRRRTIRIQDLTGRTAVLMLLLAAFLWTTLPATAWGQTSVTTEHNDNFRSGQNANELLLSPASVNAQQFGKLFTQAVDGLVVGQPLIVPGLSFPDGSVHDVVYVGTQHDSVYAFDANNMAGPLWVDSFANPAAGVTSVPIANFGCPGTGFTEMGITSTPVIDAETQTIYVVARTLENGSYFFRMHALDLTTGQEKFGGPVVISAAVGSVNFNAATQLQRPGLLLSNGVVYIGFGGNGCDTYQYYGWVMAYDAQLLSPLGTFLATPAKRGAGIWQSGGGLAADQQGNIYFSTGNGIFDASSGGSNYGDSVLQLQLGGGSFNVVDYFSPFNQNFLRTNDLDLGGGGVLLLPDQTNPPVHEMIAGGKSGTIYVLDRDFMGGFDSVQDDVVQELSAAAGQMQSVPVYWNQSVFISASSDYIKLFSFNNGLLSSTPVAQTAIKFDKPGPTSLSANGDTSGILWALLKGQRILYAFDATNLGVLYSSAQASNYRDKLGALTHFATPTIANGKVYVGGLQQVTVYGLLPRLSVTAGNGQAAIDTTLLPIPLQFQAIDSYTGNPIVGVPGTCSDGTAGGVFSSKNFVTDAFGMSTFTYTLPKKALIISITCSNLNYVPAIFTETSIPGPPVHLAIKLGNLQTASAGTVLPTPLQVKVTDANLVPVPGVTVNFTDNGAGGILSPTSAATDGSGLATTTYTTPSTPATIKITASSPGLPNASFKETSQ